MEQCKTIFNDKHTWKSGEVEYHFPETTHQITFDELTLCKRPWKGNSLHPPWPFS